MHDHAPRSPTSHLQKRRGTRAAAAAGEQRSVRFACAVERVCEHRGRRGRSALTAVDTSWARNAHPEAQLNLSQKMPLWLLTRSRPCLRKATFAHLNDNFRRARAFGEAERGSKQTSSLRRLGRCISPRSVLGLSERQKVRFQIRLGVVTYYSWYSCCCAFSEARRSRLREIRERRGIRCVSQHLRDTGNIVVMCFGAIRHAVPRRMVRFVEVSMM